MYQSPPLKMYDMLESVKTVFDCRADLINGSEERGEKARKLVTAIVNSMTTKMEIGSPMASAYLLGQPDHYTSHKFRTFYWRSYVSEIRRQCNETVIELTDLSEPKEAESMDNDEDAKLSSKVMIMSVDGQLMSYKAVLDYSLRPSVLWEISLYDFIRRSEKFKVSKSQSRDENSTDEEAEVRLIDDGGNKPKFSFLSDHPQYKTHKLSWIRQDYGYIPNFVGGMLPRRDKGDQDYYCCTMKYTHNSFPTKTRLAALPMVRVRLSKTPTSFHLFSFPKIPFIEPSTSSNLSLFRLPIVRVSSLLIKRSIVSLDVISG